LVQPGRIWSAIGRQHQVAECILHILAWIAPKATPHGTSNHQKRELKPAADTRRRLPTWLTHASGHRSTERHNLQIFLQGVAAAFAGPDADYVFDLHDEDLSVADPAGAGGPLNGFNHLGGQFVGNDDFEFHLG
jgi:hypothetical protein